MLNSFPGVANWCLTDPAILQKPPFCFHGLVKVEGELHKISHGISQDGGQIALEQGTEREGNVISIGGFW